MSKQVLTIHALAAETTSGSADVTLLGGNWGVLFLNTTAGSVNVTYSFEAVDPVTGYAAEETASTGSPTLSSEFSGSDETVALVGALPASKYRLTWTISGSGATFSAVLVVFD